MVLAVLVVVLLVMVNEEEESCGCGLAEEHLTRRARVFLSLKGGELEDVMALQIDRSS